MQTSFVKVSSQSHFPLQNLPYGVFSTAKDPEPRIGVAIGDQILDLRVVSKAGLFNGPLLQKNVGCLEQSTLNAFMATGRPTWLEARSTIQTLLSADEPLLRDNPQLLAEALIPQTSATMHLPATIGDYTDFFCSKEHAVNCGIMFRGPENPLNPNWLHLPVAYHGRASSIVISGTNVRRPWGQILPRTTESSSISTTPTPVLLPSSVLDFELEMGCFIGGPGNALGEPISINSAVDYMFGFVLLNDWSARDIQRWESMPLGPFTAKNWATSISPWVVTLEALEPFKTPAPPKDPPSLSYLTPECDSALSNCNFDVRLEASICPGSADNASDNATAPSTITRSNMRTLYWTLPQMIAHHTAGGCNLRPGDLLGTGTLSTAGEGEQGCLLELTWSGRKKVVLNESGGVERTFLEDGDVVTMTGYCQGEGYRVGFGDCTGKVLPALNLSSSLS